MRWLNHSCSEVNPTKKNQCEGLPASLGTKRRELTHIGAKPDWFRLFLYLRLKLSKGSGNARSLQPDDCKDTCPNNQAIALMCAYVTYLDVSGYAGLNGSIQVVWGDHKKRRGHTLKGQTTHQNECDSATAAVWRLLHFHPVATIIKLV